MHFVLLLNNHYLTEYILTKSTFKGGKVSHLPKILDGQNRWQKKCISEEEVLLLHNIDKNGAALRLGPWKYIKCKPVSFY